MPLKKKASSSLLLDVNVLLALAWPTHQFHAAATRRLEASAQRWATCALTQLGFIRLSSNPSVIPNAVSPAEAAALLAEMVRDRLHVYFGSLPSPVERGLLGSFGAILGPGQVTDAYLLALARRRRATFVTFDSRLRALASSATQIEILGV